jgi:hypothetical protein
MYQVVWFHRVESHVTRRLPGRADYRHNPNRPPSLMLVDPGSFSLQALRFIRKMNFVGSATQMGRARGMGTGLVLYTIQRSVIRVAMNFEPTSEHACFLRLFITNGGGW